MTRKEMLKAAAKCVCGERQDQYGQPEDNFKSIAYFWNDYIGAKYPDSAVLDPIDVAMMMALLKIARIATGTAKEDSFVDLAGYAACGCEIATKEIVVDKPVQTMEEFVEQENHGWLHVSVPTKKKLDELPDRRNVHNETCVSCGAEVPEGRMVCPECEGKR